MILRELAHSRTGDKGNLVTISLIAYRGEDFPLLVREVTPERVARHFSEIIDGPVTRYVLPHLSALNLVLRRPATLAVTRSLALDAHGKCLGSALLALEIEVTPRVKGSAD
ncbi:MAG: hypothetical protein JO300_01855 [Silvibacterium sp.]|nr:hypothetical protein [Silvibacterium sp.]MBV8438444.1 hypothetical protein [Silvibacterium sp.]